MARWYFAMAHAMLGILLIDDLGDPEHEAALVLRIIGDSATELVAGAFLRAGESGVRAARAD